MDRRTALRFLAAATTAGIAGCQSGDGVVSPPSTSVSPACPEQPSAFDVSAFENTVNCHTPQASDEQTPGLVPEPATASLPDATVEFTLTNPRETAYRTNFHQWGLYKYVDGEWYHAVSTWVPAGSGTELAAGATHGWTITVDNAELSRPVEPVQSDGEATVTGLGGGTYAFLIPGTYEPVDILPNSDEIVSYATRFEIDGPAVDLKPSDSVADVRRTGERVDVLLSEDPTHRYTFTRATPPDSDATAKRYIPEELYGWPVPRNAFAYFDDGVETVTVGVKTSPAAPQGYVTYEGETYHVESELVTDE